jgi:hypothetical protein
MSKIKLLILLFNFFLITSCVEKSLDLDVSTNLLIVHLDSYQLLNQKSEFKIIGNIKHDTNLYITNIDNTSDRENISSELSLKILDKNNCVVYEFNDYLSQFYLYASSEKFKSNTEAIKKIKFSNSEYLVKQFINDIFGETLICGQ